MAKITIILIFAGLLVLTACASSDDAAVQRQIDERVATALATIPTITPVPTTTPQPVPTPQPFPTMAAFPTLPPFLDSGAFSNSPAHSYAGAFPNPGAFPQLLCPRLLRRLSQLPSPSRLLCPQPRRLDSLQRRHLSQFLPLLPLYRRLPARLLPG